MADAATLSELRARIRALEADDAPLPEQGSRTPGEGCDRPPSPAITGDDAAGGKQGRSAFDKIVALVNASDKSELALRTRLERDGFDAGEVQEAIERAKGYGFIDDGRFGRLLIESRLRQGWGSIGIERDLRENGIDPAAFPGWPDEYDVTYEAELERALSLLDRKPPRSKNLREGAYRKAVQKGFPSSVASTAARLWSEGR